MGSRVEIEEDDLRRMYEDEKMTQFEIRKVYGVSEQTIWKRMNEFGISARIPRVYSVNEDFFKEWTKESSWIYGWFIGDGWIRGDTRFGFGLARKDNEVLYKFRDVMESEHPVKDYDKFDKRSSKVYETSELCISSPNMANDLQNLNYKDIPEWHRNHGIRGFFEAEGCVGLHVDKRSGTHEYIRTSFTQKDPAILEWIWEVLKEGVVVGGSLYQNKRDGLWTLEFLEANSVSLYHYMYDDCSELYLERKKNKFEELMARRGYL